MRLAMQGLGLGDMSKEELSDMLKAIDKDSNQLIEFGEFETMIKQKMTEKDSDAEIKRAFELFGGEPLDEEKIVVVYEKLGLEVNREHIREFVKEASGGGSNISLSEWQAVMSAMKGK
eukprot:Sspe_Gene.88806::Locus_60723_Transcript_1_1_Confidence_1.000_Length_571::g.88806::m.88806